ncbi:HET-domain-containing protein [Pyrenochaeta sp. DS3sAY3a]|nr:HET-domain-containing protein [Pyrenochaeta sp. DS3sAY3a]
MKICDYCVRNILMSKESWDFHHGSFAALEKCSGWERVATKEPTGTKPDRCLFCSTLIKDIQELAPTLQQPEYAALWPVYRWNIRTLARIQESLETVVVTFRSIARNNDTEDGGINSNFLPTRTFFLFPEHAVQPLPTAEQLSPTTDPGTDRNHQTRLWIENCDTSHTDCMKLKKATPRSQHFVPTRLLDISGAPGTPIRILETSSTPIQGPYCTLSHCWGKPDFQQLRDNNRERFMKEGVPWALFTQNFKDAIEIARALDVGYIWIDSLCIIQQSEADWTRESSRMHLVYRNSYCNIAIADSKDSAGGAFRNNRDTKDVALVRYQSPADSALFKGKTWVIVQDNLWETGLIKSILYKRGWVFQERMLAPRILHFAKHQIFWDCPSLSACESLPGGLPPPMDSIAGPDRHWRARLQEPEDTHDPLAGVVDQSMASFWKAAVEKYTSCNLTVGSDKLIAMWGIAKLLRDALGIEYGAGLWEENLEDYLAWRVADCTLTQRPSESQAKELKRDIPSWSWASMDGTIIVPDRLSDRPHYKVTDHDGHPLTFDLKGVARPARKSGTRAEAPHMPSRGASDSGAEMHRRQEQLAKENPDIKAQQDFHRSSSPKRVSRDAEPEFYSKSIRVQGHVNRGRLRLDSASKAWVVSVEGRTRVTVEAFPDIVPRLEEAVDEMPYLVVLAAKQVFKPENFNADAAEGKHCGTMDLRAIAEEDDSDKEEEEYDYAGHGILMKDAGDHHFRRTGAFRFQNLSQRAFDGLRVTVEYEGLPAGMYNVERGRKFWLD